MPNCPPSLPCPTHLSSPRRTLSLLRHTSHLSDVPLLPVRKKLQHRRSGHQLVVHLCRVRSPHCAIGGAICCHPAQPFAVPHPSLIARKSHALPSRLAMPALHLVSCFVSHHVSHLISCPPRNLLSIPLRILLAYPAASFPASCLPSYPVISLCVPPRIPPFLPRIQLCISPRFSPRIPPRMPRACVFPPLARLDDPRGWAREAQGAAACM